MSESGSQEEKFMNKVVLFFVDGLGIGQREESNPLFQLESASPLGWFRDQSGFQTFNEGVCIPTDPRLGIEGRPQSATGQTTIYTGVNAPKLLGRHVTGFPNRELRELISRESIFLKLKEMGVGPNIFANTYTPPFFSTPPRWKSATTCSVEAAGVEKCRLPDLLGGKSVFHDFTNKSLIESGYDVPLFSAKRAAEALIRLSGENRFVLYEHFVTDKIGHAQEMSTAKMHLPELANFVSETVRGLDLERTTFILTSDHGNIEDLSIRNHTLNDVPTVVWGEGKQFLMSEIRTLADIQPAIIELLK